MKHQPSDVRQGKRHTDKVDPDKVHPGQEYAVINNTAIDYSAFNHSVLHNFTLNLLDDTFLLFFFYIAQRQASSLFLYLIENLTRKVACSSSIQSVAGTTSLRTKFCRGWEGAFRAS